MPYTVNGVEYDFDSCVNQLCLSNEKVSTISTRFHVVSNVFRKYQMLTF